MDMLPVYVGLDYHEDTIRVCIMEPDGKVCFNRDQPNDVRCVAAVVRLCGQPAGVVLEACCGAADFATQLIQQTGWKVRMAHPGYVRRMKNGPDKTDAQDAELLADLLRKNALFEVWLADSTTRQLRRLVSYRDGLKAERKNVKLRIRALLREERVRQPGVSPWTKAWRRWLLTALPGEQSQWVMQQLLAQLAQRLPRSDGHRREMKVRLCRTKPANVATCAIANRWLRRLYHVMQPPATGAGQREVVA